MTAEPTSAEVDDGPRTRSASAIGKARHEFGQWCQGFDARSWRAVDKGLMDRPKWWRVELLIVPATAVVLTALLLGGWRIATVVTVVGAMSILFAIHHLRTSYRQRCVAAVPDSLALMSAALAAGHTIDQAITTAIRSKGPLVAEFSRVHLRTRLGEPLPDALDAMASRIGSPELRWAAIALRVNARVGGEVATLLTTVAHTIRERDIVQRTMRALSAEGRLSAWVLGLLPPGFALLLLFAQPTYLQPLIADGRGRWLLGAAIALFGVGLVWLRRAVRLESG